jgi:hypothetical protein
MLSLLVFLAEKWNSVIIPKFPTSDEYYLTVRQQKFALPDSILYYMAKKSIIIKSISKTGQILQVFFRQKSDLGYSTFNI